MNSNLPIKMKVKLIVNMQGREYTITTSDVDVSLLRRCSVENLDSRLHEFLRFLSQMPEEFVRNGFRYVGIESDSTILLSERRFAAETNSLGQMIYQINQENYTKVDSNSITTINVRHRDLMQIATDILTP